MAASNRKVKQTDFLIDDLVVSVSRAGGSGSVFLPADDTVIPPSPISPIASVLAQLDHFEVVREVMANALRNKEEIGSIGRAFVDGDIGGNPAIRLAIQEVGKAVVASAAYAAMGGSAGMPNPECGGSSYETIPSPLTPVVRYGRLSHKVSELGRMRQQLKVAVQAFDKAAIAAKPVGTEVGTVRAELQQALKTLG